jgi:hypothetical protein
MAMARLVLLNKNAHQHLKVNTQIAEAQGANLHMVPVMLSEFLKLAVQYPIAFTKNKDNGRFICVAMFGFNPGENLFWKNNNWETLYLPLHIVRQPFFLGKDDTNESASGENRFVICLDTENPSLQTQEGEMLFDVQGNETAYLEKTKAILAELLDGESITQSFIDKLIKLNLLQSMHLEITFANNESTRIEGMYTINEDRLNKLTKDELFDLHSLGYLQPIYTITSSLGHIYGLVHKKNLLLAG